MLYTEEELSIIIKKIRNDDKPLMAGVSVVCGGFLRKKNETFCETTENCKENDCCSKNNIQKEILQYLDRSPLIVECCTTS